MTFIVFIYVWYLTRNYGFEFAIRNQTAFKCQYASTELYYLDKLNELIMNAQFEILKKYIFKLHIYILKFDIFLTYRIM